MKDVYTWYGPLTDWSRRPRTTGLWTVVSGLQPVIICLFSVWQWAEDRCIWRHVMETAILQFRVCTWWWQWSCMWQSESTSGWCGAGRTKRNSSDVVREKQSARTFGAAEWCLLCGGDRRSQLCLRVLHSIVMEMYHWRVWCKLTHTQTRTPHAPCDEFLCQCTSE